MAPKITITKSGPGLSQVRTRLRDLSRMDALVGIPARTTLRRKDPINNASLLFIHTKGSPVRKIPKRPVIEPAITASGNKELIAGELKDAAKAALKGDNNAAYTALDRAGLAGENASKQWFTDPRNNWAPNAPSTIRRKDSDRPLIDTVALRRSITHVVRKVR